MTAKTPDITSRLEKIRAALRSASLDALIFWRTEEVVMACGHQPHWGLSVCLIPAVGDPVFYTPELEPRQVIPSGFVVRRFPWGVPGGGDPWMTLESQLRTDIGAGCVGWKPTGGHGALPANYAETPPFPQELLERLPLRDAGKEVDALLSKKTPDDIARIRIANQAALHGLQVFRGSLHPGRTEAHVAAAVESAILGLTGGALKGADSGTENSFQVGQARGWAFVQSGPNTAFAGSFSRSSGRTLAPGDQVIIELATCVDGYWSDLTRTEFVGEPDANQKRIREVVQSAQTAALEALRPGVTGQTVDAAARAVIERAGWGQWFTHATGHSVGFRYHDSGPALAPGSLVPLEEGMVLTVEPGIYNAEQGWGCRLETNVVITNSGWESLDKSNCL